MDASMLMRVWLPNGTLSDAPPADAQKIAKRDRRARCGKSQADEISCEQHHVKSGDANNDNYGFDKAGWLASCRKSPGDQGDQREAADADVRFVSERNRCLPFAPPCGLAAPAAKNPMPVRANFN